MWIGRLGGFVSVAQFVVGIPANIASMSEWQDIFRDSPLSAVLAVIGIILIVYTFLPIRPFVTKKRIERRVLQGKQELGPKQKTEPAPVRDRDPQASEGKARTYIDSSLLDLINEASKHTNISWSRIVSDYIGKWVPETTVEVSNVSKFSEDYIYITARFVPREKFSIEAVGLSFALDSGVDEIQRGEVLRITGEIEKIEGSSADLVHCEVIGRSDVPPEQ